MLCYFLILFRFYPIDRISLNRVQTPDGLMSNLTRFEVTGSEVTKIRKFGNVNLRADILKYLDGAKEGDLLLIKPFGREPDGAAKIIIEKAKDEMAEAFGPNRSRLNVYRQLYPDLDEAQLEELAYKTNETAKRLRNHAVASKPHKRNRTGEQEEEDKG